MRDLQGKLMKEPIKRYKMRTWYVYWVNCECGSHNEAFQTRIKEPVLCSHCHQKLNGLVEYLGSAEAYADLEAIMKIK